MTQHDPNLQLFDSQRQVAILAAISNMAEHMLTQRDWKTQINDSLAQLGNATGVSRVYLHERRIRRGVNHIRFVAEWVVSPDLETINDPLLQDFVCAELGLGDWEQLLLSGESIVGDAEDFSPSERAFMEHLNIHSIALVPIMISEVGWGVIGFDQCFATRRWTKGEIETLKTAGRILGAAIRHNADVAALHIARDELESRVTMRTEELSHNVDRLERAISGRDQVEKALRDSETQYRLLAENATDAISRHAPDGRYLFVSPACAQITGYSPCELVGESPYDLMHPSDVPQVQVVHQSVFVCTDIQTANYRLRHKEGHYVYVESTCKSIRDKESGDATEIICTTRNATERVRITTEQQVVGDVARFFLDADNLDVIFARLPALLCRRFEYTRCGIFLLDPSTKELKIAGLFGLSEDKYLGRRFQLDEIVSGHVAETGVAIYSSDINHHPHFATSAMRGENARTFISVPMRIDQHVVGVLDLVDNETKPLPQTLRDTIQTVANLLAIQIDRIETEKRMRRQSAELIHVARLGTMGEMASGLAHELNQPLSGIVSFTAAAENLLMADPQQALKYIQLAGAAANRAAELIRHMRHLVIRRKPKRSTVNPNQLVKETLQFVEHRLGRHQIMVQTNLDSNIQQTLLDGIQIQQVIINLINNAIDAIVSSEPQERLITITTRQDADRFTFEAIDTGSMETETINDQVFDQHFTTKKGGMGLGLSISRTIIEAHGGLILAGRDEENRTRFYFQVPMRSAT